MYERSYYLDDLPHETGETVVCVANICSEWIKVGCKYTVLGFGKIMSETGEVFVNPSCRFKKV